MNDAASQFERSRWPHFFAVVLACATFPLIWVGGLVTTYDAGMAVPDWPTTYGYNMFLYPVSTWLSGPWDLFIEHGHRLLGSLAGILTIALNVAIWKFDKRRWMRYAGLAALALVVSQGLLGGMRVRLSSTDFARAHGVTGPLFFATTIVLCVLTSSYWSSMRKTDSDLDISRKSVIVGWFLFALIYFQLVLGAHLRHPNIDWSPALFRSVVVFHVIAAFVVLAQTIQVGMQSRKMQRLLRRPAWLLVALIGCQVALGFATWRAKYGWPSFVPVFSEAKVDQPYEIATHNALVGATVQNASMSQAITVTSHVALGSLILATSVCYSTRLTRAYALQPNQAVAKSATVDPSPITPMIGGAVS